MQNTSTDKIPQVAPPQNLDSTALQSKTLTYRNERIGEKEREKDRNRSSKTHQEIERSQRQIEPEISESALWKTADNRES